MISRFERIKNGFKFAKHYGCPLGLLGATIGSQLSSKPDFDHAFTSIRELAKLNECLFTWTNSMPQPWAIRCPDTAYQSELNAKAKSAYFSAQKKQSESENMMMITGCVIGFTFGALCGFKIGYSMTPKVEAKPAKTTFQQRIDELKLEEDDPRLKVFSEFNDPASFELMNDPVVLGCGHTCDRTTAMKLDKCSICRAKVKEKELRENWHTIGLIEARVTQLEKEVKVSSPTQLSQRELSEHRDKLFSRKSKIPSAEASDTSVTLNPNALA